MLIGIALLTVVSASRQPVPANAEPLLFLADAGPIILYDHPLCSLANGDAAAASIAGQDGGSSIEIDGTSYFIFGDTTAYFGNPEPVVIAPNGIATSTDTNPADCLDLTHKAANGIAQPLLPQLPGETTLWPDGLIETPAGDVWFFVGSVVPGPTPWWVHGVGLGRFDPATLEATRINDMMWDTNSGFRLGHIIAVRGAAVVDGYAYILMVASESATYLGRVPLASVPDVAAYQYWTGSAWTSAPSAAEPLWIQAGGFNGAAVRWSDIRQEWIAIYNAQTLGVRVRTAPALTGPWSAETAWIDCARFVETVVIPLCYSAAFHPQYDRDGGRTMTISFSTYLPYEVVLHEIRLATPIYSWRNAAAETRLQPRSPGAGFTQEGIAFYASDIAAPGHSAVRRFLRSNGEQLYAFTYSEAGVQDMGIAFYASATADVDGANVTYDPVYRWDKGAEHLYSPLPGLAELGYTRSATPFFALCGDADADTASDCLETAQGTNLNARDTDGDGFGDRPAGTANPNTVANADNCPLVANPSQGNIDGEPLLVTTGIQDGTNPKADALGDACDSDRDNDGLTNTAETAAGTNGDIADSDGDLWPDRAETRCSSNPLDPASRPTGADSDGDRLPDLCEIRIGSNPTLKDSDVDGINDYIEVRWLSSPRDADSDDDGRDDACEIASVNLDYGVNAIDLSLIARRFGMTGIEGRPGDLNRDGTVQATDLVVAATNFGPCT